MSHRTHVTDNLIAIFATSLKLGLNPGLTQNLNVVLDPFWMCATDYCSVIDVNTSLSHGHRFFCHFDF